MCACVFNVSSVGFILFQWILVSECAMEYNVHTEINDLPIRTQFVWDKRTVVRRACIHAFYIYIEEKTSVGTNEQWTFVRLQLQRRRWFRLQYVWVCYSFLLVKLVRTYINITPSFLLSYHSHARYVCTVNVLGDSICTHKINVRREKAGSLARSLVFPLSLSRTSLCVCPCLCQCMLVYLCVVSFFPASSSICYCFVYVVVLMR